eukprot:scaffold5768_cov128-Cylindrotheca_fusiformis.AAC.2
MALLFKSGCERLNREVFELHSKPGSFTGTLFRLLGSTRHRSSDICGTFMRQIGNIYPRLGRSKQWFVIGNAALKAYLGKILLRLSCSPDYVLTSSHHLCHKSMRILGFVYMAAFQLKLNKPVKGELVPALLPP